METPTGDLPTTQPTRGTILVAASDATRVATISQELRRRGYRCIGAAATVAAARMMTLVAFDGVVVELTFLAEDGVTPFAAWAHGIAPETPVIVLAASPFAAMSLRSPNVEVFPEPVQIDRLARVLAALIRDRGERVRHRIAGEDRGW